MKKLAILESGTGIGGAEINLLRLALVLDPKEWQVTFLIPGEGPLSRELSRCGIQWQVFSSPTFTSTSRYFKHLKFPDPLAISYDVLAILAQARTIRDFLREHRITLVHTNSMLSHLGGGLAARWAGIPCLWHLQDIVDPHAGFRLFRPFLNVAAWYLPSRIVCISRAVTTQIPSRSIQHKIQVIHNGIDPGVFSPSGRKPYRSEWLGQDYKMIVGNVGRITSWKGQEITLALARRAQAEGLPIRFIIVGDSSFGEPDYENHLRRLTHQYNLSDQVVFAGWLDDMPGAYRSMDLLVHPVRTPEPFGLTVAEAMACCTPVVTFDWGGAGEVVGAREYGLLVPPGDVDAVWERIKWVWGNPDLTRAMGAKARNRIQSEFSFERFATALLRVYDSLATGCQK